MTQAAKPPAQVAGVTGIATVPIVLTPEPSQIDWPTLVGLPPFQMFIATLWPNTQRIAADQHVRAVLQAHRATPALYERYASWHAEQGLWPNETPMGREL